MTKRAAAVVLVVAALSFAGPPPSADAGSHQPPKLFGMATDDWEADFSTFTSDAGRAPAFQQFFATIDDGWPRPWIEGRLSTLHADGSVGYFELTTSDLGAYLAGDRDAQITAMVDQFADWLDDDPTHGLLLAPFPEANLTEHAWGGDPSAYKDFFLRLIDEFADRGIGGDQMRMVFAMNGLSSTGLSYPLFYPGDEYVDIVGFSKINRGGSGWRDYDEAFQMHIDEMQQQISHIKPLLITQTGSVDNSSGNRDAWLDDMFTGLADESQVIGAIYFNVDKTVSSDQDYRIVENGALDPAVVTGYATWSEPTETSWIFDGGMDAWEDQRAAELVFLDAQDSSFLTEILWMHEQGITGGCAPLYFCPDDTVTREQMASFLARALDLPPTTTDYFSDDTGSVHEDNINRMAAAGITSGCGVDQYCPGDDITRAQMASFLARALSFPPSATDWFTDDDGSTHESNINSMADAGVTLGCAVNLYCPGESVIREHMAAFLYRALAP